MSKQKYIQMTKAEFIEALQVVCQSVLEDCRYCFSKQPFVDFYGSFKNFLLKSKNTIKYCFSRQLLTDIKKKIVEGIKFTLSQIMEIFSKDTKKNKPKDEFNGFFKDIKETLTCIFNEISRPITKDVFIERMLNFKGLLYEIANTIIFVVIALIIIRFFLFDVRWVPSGSMLPTIKEGDRIVVERVSRFYSIPKRGDIMVFYPPTEEIKNTPIKLFTRLTGIKCEDTAFIKRVIGLPNEKFEIKADEYGMYTVYIDDKPLNEPYVMSKFESAPCARPDVNCGPFIIPENEFMMMGDNRANSWDGRFWGTLNKDRFIGRAVFRFWPLNRIKTFAKTEY